MIASSYCDALATEYCGDFRAVQALITQLKKEGIPIKFVDWVHNSVSYSVMGVYGETYG